MGNELQIGLINEIIDKIIPVSDKLGIPRVILAIMTLEQYLQGNKIAPEIFIDNINAFKNGGGFNWDNSPDGEPFWVDIIMIKTYEVFINKYCPKESKETLNTITYHSMRLILEGYYYFHPTIVNNSIKKYKIKADWLEPFRKYAKELEEENQKNMSSYIEKQEDYNLVDFNDIVVRSRISFEKVGVPKAVLAFMLLEQWLQQDGKIDESVFIEKVHSDIRRCGFNWEKTLDGKYFWHDILIHENYNDFLNKYFPKIATALIGAIPESHIMVMLGHYYDERLNKKEEKNLNKKEMKSNSTKQEREEFLNSIANKIFKTSQVTVGGLKRDITLVVAVNKNDEVFVGYSVLHPEDATSEVLNIDKQKPNLSKDIALGRAFKASLLPDNSFLPQPFNEKYILFAIAENIFKQIAKGEIIIKGIRNNKK